MKKNNKFDLNMTMTIEFFFIIFILIYLFLCHFKKELYPKVIKITDGKTKTNISRIKHQVNQHERLLLEMMRSIDRLKYSSDMTVNTQDSIFKQTQIIIAKMERDKEIYKRVKQNGNNITNLHSDLKRIGKINVGVCSQFIIRELEIAVGKIETKHWTNFDISHISTILEDDDDLHRIDIPKDIKGLVGECHVLNYIKKHTEQLKTLGHVFDLFVIYTANQTSTPDIVIEYILNSDLNTRKKLCIEVKNHHIDVNQENVNKFIGYMNRECYNTGILVNIGKGGIFNIPNNYYPAKLNNKNVLYISNLNYHLSPLYCAISSLII